MDESAVSEAYRLYGAAIWRRCQRVLRDPDLALDVTQEVFVRCLRNHRRLRPGRELLAWLYRVATNLCLNELRNRRQVRLSALGAVPDLPVAPEAAGRQTMLELLEGLDPETQAIVVCVYVDGMTQPEAAEVVGVSERTVRYRLGAFIRRGRQKLEIHMQEDC